MMRIIAFLLVFFSFSEAVSQIPTSHLQVWYASDTGVISFGNKVTEWQDLSGNNFHATQPTALVQPIITQDTILGKPVIQFNESSWLEVSFGQTFPQPFEIFIIFNSTSTSTQFVLDWGTPRTALYLSIGRVRMFAGIDLDLYKSLPFGYFLNTLVFNGMQSLNIENSSLINTGNVSSNGLAGLRIGSAYNDMMFFGGNISEIIVYDTLLSESNNSIVENYLKNKYAPPVNFMVDSLFPSSFCPYTINVGHYYLHYLWSTGDTTRDIHVQETGDYWVRTTDIFGRVTSDTIHVEFPYTKQTDKFFCLQDSVTINTNLNHSYDFLWSTGSTDSLLVVSNPGTYWVEITDSTALHCTIRDTIVVAADSFPVTASLGPDRSICSGERIELIDGGSEATLYSWSNSSSSSSIIISNPGQYSLTVTDGNGCVARDTIDIDIKGVKPKVGFLSSSPCLGNSMNFTDTTVTILPDLPHQWQWAFGDGDLATVQNPTHIYTNAGLHNVNLQVVSDSGCIADTTLSVYVLHLPVANFNPTNGCENAPLLFHDTSSTADGSVTSWTWNFGNGNASTIQNPVDSFSNVGIYNVQLIIQTNFGCKDTITKTITIRERPNAAFIHNEPCQGTSMNFSDYSTSQNYYPIVSWKWNFGDGGVDSIENPVHTYTLPGIFQAALTVRSLSGCTSTYEHPVELHAFPQPYYSVSWPCAGSPVLFTDSSYVSGVTNDSVVSWMWNFGSHGVFNSSSPLVLFDTAGVYSFTLTVNSNAACSKSMTDFITVFPSPVSDFTFSPEYGTAPLDVAFTSSAIGANTYVWNFGDGSSSSLQNPQHSYLVNGDYNVVFIATNGYNCSDTSHNLVQVMNPNVDMAALSASAQLDGNYLVVSGVFRNYGNRAVKKADLFLDVPGFPPVREEWIGNLQPGVSMNYSFKTQMFSLKVPSYLCVSVKNPDGITDLHPLNDMACYSQTDSLFVSEPFPNPASGDVTLAVVTPFSDELAVAVYDAVGKLVISQTITSVEGVNNLHLNTATLSNGLYTIRVQYRGLKEVRKFVRN